MATFLTLPNEIHDGIAEHCEKNDLISLCCTSKWVNELYWPVLYRHVNLRLDCMAKHAYNQFWHERKRQRQFVHTLLSHPGYGSYIRSFKGFLCIFDRDGSSDHHQNRIYDENLWRAMTLLTHVRSVDIGSRRYYAYIMMESKRQFPTDLFRSATSVTLAGRMPYNLAKSILDAINPAMLKYLCLDKVQECGIARVHNTYRPGDKGKDGRIIAYGAISSLLTTLTGQCTALRTLILRRIGQEEEGFDWHAAAEEASYNEWASFIRSVQGMVEKFTFKQADHGREVPTTYHSSHCFRELALLEDHRTPRRNGQAGNAALTAELRALLGGNTKIVVEENADARVLIASPDSGWPRYCLNDDQEAFGQSKASIPLFMLFIDNSNNDVLKQLLRSRKHPQSNEKHIERLKDSENAVYVAKEDYPKWTPPPLEELLDRIDEYCSTVQSRRFAASRGHFEEQLLFALYRLYECFVLDKVTQYRNQLEYFWRKHQWPVHDIPDPQDPDPGRYAFLAGTTYLMARSFNARVKLGLTRDAKPLMSIKEVEKAKNWA
ncbi:hypothetical protein MMC29_003954 [Sticta canariensis]|nr:hypothetical protein [Sticta canariensis]